MYLTNITTTGWSTRRGLSIFSLLLACFHFQLTSAGLFSGKGPSIHQETVYMNPNTTSISTDNASTSSDITSGVRMVSNTATIGDKGLEGIGYILDTPCVGLPSSSSTKNNVHAAYSRIALVPLNNCTLDWKVIRAQNDQANGVIVYSPNGDEVNLDDIHFSVPIVIPVFVVSSNDGNRMAQDINANVQLQKASGTLNALQKQFKFTMLANEKSFPTVWEFTLIIVVVLLFLSLVISVAMHCHLYRLRRNYALRNNIPDGTEMMVIHKSALNKLPIKVWHMNGELNKRSGHKDEGNHQCAVVMEPPPAYDPQSMVSLPPFKSEDEETAQSVCPICLDDFKEGDEVRELPCCHHYHLECIDPWLTTKSGTCPMCKLPISSDLTPAYLPPENTSWWYTIASSIFAPCMAICR